MRICGCSGLSPGLAFAANSIWWEKIPENVDFQTEEPNPINRAGAVSRPHAYYPILLRS